MAIQKQFFSHKHYITKIRHHKQQHASKCSIIKTSTFCHETREALELKWIEKRLKWSNFRERIWQKHEAKLTLVSGASVRSIERGLLSSARLGHALLMSRRTPTMQQPNSLNDNNHGHNYEHAQTAHAWTRRCSAMSRRCVNGDAARDLMLRNQSIQWNPLSWSTLRATPDKWNKRSKSRFHSHLNQC